MTIKVGVIGMGRFGRLHALTLAGLGEAELAGVVARRQESLDAMRDELPDVRGWTNLTEAIEESGAEAWVVACTTSAHVEVTKQLLTSGKTVLLEKPIADNLQDAESLAPLVRPDSSNLMIGHIVLFNSEFQELRTAAAARSPISYIDCVRHRPASIVEDFPGENPLHAAMVHDLYCVQALLVGAEPTDFSCQFHRTSGGAVDLALAQIHWSNGALTSLAASYLTPTGMPPRGFDRMEVFGEGWSARVSPNPRPLEVWDERASWPMALEVRSNPPSGMLAEELRCFCRVAQGCQAVPTGATYSDAMQVQQWMETIEQTARR